MKNEDICFIIPCYNEEACIENVLNKLKKSYPTSIVVVIDDGSEDASVAKVRAFASTWSNLHLIQIPFNIGIGTTIQTGFKFAVYQKCKYAIKIDADGQHPIEAIEKMLKPLNNNQADVVNGSRFLKRNGYQSTVIRRWGIVFFRYLISILIRQKVSDTTSGFRAYNEKALHFSSLHYPTFDYPEPEEIVILKKNGLRIQEIPVCMNERQGGESSINWKKSIYYMVKVTFASLIASTRKPEISK